MLQVELDVFSGMPNPSFQLTSQEEAQLVERVLAQPAQMSPVDPTEMLGLGYRGLIVRLAKPDDGAWAKAAFGSDLPAELRRRPGALPNALRLGLRQGDDTAAAEFLLEVAERRLTLADEVREVIAAGVTVHLPEVQGPGSVGSAVEKDVDHVAAAWWACPSPYYSANADYFNVPDAVGLNNCYCFASNVLANSRYAMPGRYRGQECCPPLECTDVIRGLRTDGWVEGCQTSTLTIAAVVWPGQDYHFYRLVSGGPEWWWGHKPGGTPARYTDESNLPLRQPLRPDNCNRGPYSHFCGFFYQNNDTAYCS